MQQSVPRGDEHVFSNEIERERGVKALPNGSKQERTSSGMMGRHASNSIAGWRRTRPRARCGFTRRLGMFDKDDGDGETIAAMPAGDVTFADNEILWQNLHMIPGRDRLLPTNSWPIVIGTWDRLLRPRVPVIYMYSVPQMDVLRTRLRTSSPATSGTETCSAQTGLGFRLHDGLHRFSTNQSKRGK